MKRWVRVKVNRVKPFERPFRHAGLLQAPGLDRPEEFTAENAKNAEEEKNIGTQTRHTDGGQVNADLLD